ncbi:MAG: phosphoribosylanthranilate isomerase [Verrucomicrobia bacterium]|nr:phosphoribosylanthranilate isomerase [Verrucomicrobiota bacterium]
MPDEVPAIAVKVCGITTVGDAIMCAEAGVQMIGLNFARESRRFIRAEAAGEIVRAVRQRFPETKCAGVFVNESRERVIALARKLKLDAVQLHGDEPPEYARALSGCFVIKAFRVGHEYDESAAAQYPASAILLDTWSGTLRGGTGETFDWSVAASLARRINRVVLAGGLTAENVTAAIRIVNPSGVDVCSGVEDAPGRKSAAKLRRFLEGVREGGTVPA